MDEETWPVSAGPKELLDPQLGETRARRKFLCIHYLFWRFLAQMSEKSPDINLQKYHFWSGHGLGSADLGVSWIIRGPCPGCNEDAFLFSLWYY